jgi:hypothetical protein
MISVINVSYKFFFTVVYALGITSEPAENLPFKFLVTHFTSFSVTGKMNMVLGQKIVLCYDI